MNHLFAMISFTIATALLGNCNGSRYISLPSEAVDDVSTFWKLQNNIDTPYITLSEKAWYQDSIGITQIRGVFTVVTDSSRSTNITTIGYRLVDLRRKWAYEYESFSDTASVKKKYRYTDTTFFTGWKFEYRKPIEVETIQFLPDTTINAVTYKRCKLTSIFNQTRFEGIGLFRCDKKTTNFQIDSGLSNRVGCPLVFFRSYPINNPHARLDREIKFISDYLPDSVVRVFAAWKKNENTHPVQ